MEQLEKKDYFQAGNSDELLYAIQRKKDYIIIQENYRNEFLQNTQLPVSETAEMGFQLGFRGAAGIFEELFYQISKLFSKASKQQKEIDHKIRKYTVKEMDNKQILLYLRQLDY